MIDEVEIYNRALSLNEIVAIYNAGICGKRITGHQSLTVSKTGSGSGTVTSDPEEINCGDTCSAQFVLSTDVTLTATPDSGSIFGGWSGDCDSNGRVTMNADKSCTATFGPAQNTLAVARKVWEAARLQAIRGGIDCDGSRQNIALGKPVTALTDVVPGYGSPESTVDGLCIDPNDCLDLSGYWYSYQGDPSYNRFIIDLLSSVPIVELHFLPLQIHSYTIWTSDNNIDWAERHNATGPFPGYVITIPVNGAYSARYIKYEGLCRR